MLIHRLFPSGHPRPMETNGFCCHYFLCFADACVIVQLNYAAKSCENSVYMTTAVCFNFNPQGTVLFFIWKQWRRSKWGWEGPPVIINVSAWSGERFKVKAALHLHWEVFNSLRCTSKVKRLWSLHCSGGSAVTVIRVMDGDHFRAPWYL